MMDQILQMVDNSIENFKRKREDKKKKVSTKKNQNDKNDLISVSSKSNDLISVSSNS